MAETFSFEEALAAPEAQPSAAPAAPEAFSFEEASQEQTPAAPAPATPESALKWGVGTGLRGVLEMNKAFNLAKGGLDERLEQDRIAREEAARDVLKKETWDTLSPSEKLVASDFLARTVKPTARVALEAPKGFAKLAMHLPAAEQDIAGRRLARDNATVAPLAKYKTGAEKLNAIRAIEAPFTQAQQSLERAFPDIQPESVKRPLGFIGESVGNMAGNLVYGPMALASGTLSELNDAYDREIARQEREGEDLDPEKAFAKSTVYSGATVPIELGLGIGRIMRQIKRAFGSKPAAELGRKFFRERLKDFAAGGTQEGLERAMQDLIVEGKLEPGAILQEAAMGAVGEGFIGGAVGTAGKIRQATMPRGQVALVNGIYYGRPDPDYEKELHALAAEEEAKAPGAGAFSFVTDPDRLVTGDDKQTFVADSWYDPNTKKFVFNLASPANLFFGKSRQAMREEIGHRLLDSEAGLAGLREAAAAMTPKDYASMAQRYSRNPGESDLDYKQRLTDEFVAKRRRDPAWYNNFVLRLHEVMQTFHLRKLSSRDVARRVMRDVERTALAPTAAPTSAPAPVPAQAVAPLAANIAQQLEANAPKSVANAQAAGVPADVLEAVAEADAAETQSHRFSVAPQRLRPYQQAYVEALARKGVRGGFFTAGPPDISGQGSIVFRDDTSAVPSATGADLARGREQFRVDPLTGRLTYPPQGEFNRLSRELDRQRLFSVTPPTRRMTAISVAPVRVDTLSEFKRAEITKRAEGPKFGHMQRVISDVAEAFGVPIVSREAAVGGWRLDTGELSMEVPEYVVFDTDDIDLVSTMAGIIGASAPELQNSVMVWQDNEAGVASMAQVEVKNAVAGNEVAKAWVDKNPFSGFTFFPDKRIFSVVLGGATNEELGQATREFVAFVEEQRNEGRIKEDAKASYRVGTARFHGQSSYESDLGAGRLSARARPAEARQGIYDVVGRAQSRLDQYRAAQLTQQKAKEQLAQLPVPAESAEGVVRSLHGRTFETIRQYARWLDARFKARHGVSMFDIGSPQALRSAARDLVYDVLTGLGADGSGQGWYDARVRAVFAEIRKIHPELDTDPKAKLVFTAILASTSQGYTVQQNFEIADAVYERWKRDGKMPMDMSFAKADAPIKENLQKIQSLIDERGIDWFSRFMVSEVTGGYLRDELEQQPTGVTLTDSVRGSRILGPKIGAFFLNLRGYFDHITMDLWYTRTMHRYIGESAVPLESPEAQAMLQRFRVELRKQANIGITAGPFPGGRLYDVNVREAMANDEAAVDAASQIFNQWGANGYVRFPDGSSIEKAARTVKQHLSDMKAAPQNKTVRLFFEQVLREGQRQLKEMGFELSEADLQAILWYREQRLFNDVGVPTPPPQDYVDAVMNLRRKLAKGEGIWAQRAREARYSVTPRTRKAQYKNAQVLGPATFRYSVTAHGPQVKGPESSVFGWGLSFSQAYWSAQERAQGAPLRTVKLDVEDNELLDWDKPLSEQSAAVQAAVRKVMPAAQMQRTGGELYEQLRRSLPYDPKATAGERTSKRLLGAGLKGIRVGDIAGRGSNYTVFSEDVIVPVGQVAERFSVTPEFKRWWPQTDTPEFQRWFKDSKVVDERGNPLLVWNGWGFSANRTMNPPNKYVYGPFHNVREEGGRFGFFFTPFEDVARGYGKNVRGVFLSIQKPLSFADSRYTARGFQQLLDDNGVKYQLDTSRAYRFYGDRAAQLSTWEWFLEQNNGDPSKLKQAIKDAGYDGIKLFDDTGSPDEAYQEKDLQARLDKFPTWVAFEPTQIKSADENVGTFSPTNPDIRYSATKPTLVARALATRPKDPPTEAGLAHYKAAIEAEMMDPAKLDKHHAAYLALRDSKGGTNFAADVARQLDPNYNNGFWGGFYYSRTSERWASWLIKKIIEREVSQPANGRALIMSGGGAGAGKTRAMGLLKHKRDNDLVYDSTMRDPVFSDHLIQLAQKNGWRVTVMYVHRPMENVFPAVLKRSMEEGRWITFRETSEIHRSAQNGVEQTHQRWNGVPGVEFWFFTNPYANDGVPKEPYEVSAADVFDRNGKFHHIVGGKAIIDEELERIGKPIWEDRVATRDNPDDPDSILSELLQKVSEPGWEAGDLEGIRAGIGERHHGAQAAAQRQSVTPYTKGRLARAFASIVHGDPLPRAFRDIRQWGLGMQKYMEENLRLLTLDTRRALHQEFRTPADRTAAEDRLMAYWLGDAPLNTVGGPAVQRAAAAFRDTIDQLTETAVAQGLVPETQKETWLDNQGAWLKRTYLAFDPTADWNYDTLLRRRNAGDPEVTRIWNAVVAYLNSQRPNMSPAELEATMRALVDRREVEDVLGISGGTAAGGGNRFAVDIGSLLRRKELPVQVRDWMGQIKDPFVRGLQSSKWMAQFITRNLVQRRFANLGIQTGILSEKPLGRDWVELYPNQTLLVPKRDEEGNVIKTDEGDVVSEYRQRVDRRHQPLHGLYTSPEFAEALREFDGRMNQIQGALNGLQAMGQLYLRGVGYIKAAKVGLNPYSYMLNTLGGVVMRLGAGGVNPVYFKDALNAIARGANPVDGNATAGRLKARADYLLASQAGLIGQGVLLGDVRTNLQRTTEPEALRRAVASLRDVLADPRAGGARTRLFDALSDIVQLPGDIGIKFMDDVFRVSAFMDELALARKAFPNQTNDQQVQWAADRASNLYQTYDRLPRLLRDLSRVGVLNTFVSFKLELFRNAYWIGRYAAQGMASGNPVLVRDGALKAVSLLAMAMAPYALAALSRAMTDTDDDEVDAFQRWSVPPWDRGEELVILERAKSKWRYVPMGYMLPHYELTRAFNAGWKSVQDPNPEVALTKAMQGMLTDYFGPGAFVGPAVEAIANKRIAGGQITYAEGARGAADRLKYLARAWKPNIGDPLWQSYMAASGKEGTYGRQYDYTEVGLKLAGIRTRTVDVAKQMPFVMRNFDQRWRDATSYENVAKRRFPKDKDAQAQAKAYADRTRAELRQQYRQFRQDLTQRLGVSPQAFAAAEKEARVLKDLRTVQ